MKCEDVPTFVLLRLSQAATWWMDGTFKSNPSIFAQLYTIHIKVSDEFVPHMWCLLPDKQAATYVRLLRLLKQEAAARNLHLQPNAIHIDFEQAVVQSVTTELGIHPTGCLFHYCQSILRHVQHLGLQVAYNTNNPPEVRTWIRRLISLPLVPPIRLDQAYRTTVAQSPIIPGRDEMNTYVFNTFVDPNGALFDRGVWNCYGAKDRTTNACEGYHSVINKHFRQAHPDPYKFISFLQQQEAELERRVQQLLHGAPPRKRKTAYVLVDESLDRLRETYFGVGMPGVARLLQYMDAVAYQMYDVKH